MTTFRLMKFDQKEPALELRGSSMIQRDESVEIVDAEHNTVASVFPKSGYYLFDVEAVTSGLSALGGAGKEQSATSAAPSVLRLR